MKVRSDIIKVYKDVHTWGGIVCGLMLFIAFYAGAITMFEKPLERWATPLTALGEPLPMARAPELVAAVLAAYPQAARNYSVVADITPDQPARVIWRERGARPRQFTEYGANFGPDGKLRVEKLRKAAAAAEVDRLHQLVGLPFPDAVSRMIMGGVALAYFVALISGLIVLLPTLSRDLFALRLGNKCKRMWLDVHNALGLVSLPFHLVIALTSVVFAFHDQIYDAQERVLYAHAIEWGHERAPGPGPAAKPLPAPDLLSKVRAQLPGFEVHSLSFSQTHGHWEARVVGLDIRHGTRARTYASTSVDPYSGIVDQHDLPGAMGSWDASVNAFFMLHFGSFGGNLVRWAYLLMGLAGAGLFYTGNLLWLESRRRKARHGGRVEQSRNVRVLAALTVGIALGSVAGISVTVAAAKWLPARVDDLVNWHMGIFYAVFLAAVGWALWRGAARAASELLRCCAVCTLLVPLSSLAGIWRLAGTWNAPGQGIAVESTAFVASVVFLLLAHHAGRRGRNGAVDSVWSHSHPVTTAQSS